MSVSYFLIGLGEGVASIGDEKALTWQKEGSDPLTNTDLNAQTTAHYCVLQHPMNPV